MIINLSPVRIDDKALKLSVVGKVVTVNGEDFDFSPMLEGSSLPNTAIDSYWFHDGPFVNMENGQLELTVLFPIPYNYSQEQAFPKPIAVISDGEVWLPQSLPIPKFESVELTQVAETLQEVNEE